MAPAAPQPAPVFAQPGYWDEACQHLSRKDRIMKRLIAQSDGACLQTRGDAFITLARCIVGQQISVKAAQIGVGPLREAAAQDDGRPTCSGSRSTTCARPVCRRARSNTWSTWRCTSTAARSMSTPGTSMDDETIIAELVGIRGIGRWTAEMFLIFHLLRPNVLPLDDIGLINGISQNYFSGEVVSRSDAREVAVAWTPYCSVATWYIWRSLDPLPVAY